MRRVILDGLVLFGLTLMVIGFYLREPGPFAGGLIVVVVARTLRTIDKEVERKNDTNH